MSLKELENDLRQGMCLWPENQIEAILKKVNAKVVAGNRIWWYYEDDKEFCATEGFDPRARAGYSGIIIPAPDIEIRGRELDVDDVVVVNDEYPTEKCCPNCQYIALVRLLAHPELVEIFDGQ